MNEFDDLLWFCKNLFLYSGRSIENYKQLQKEKNGIVFDRKKPLIIEMWFNFDKSQLKCHINGQNYGNLCHKMLNEKSQYKFGVQVPKDAMVEVMKAYAYRWKIVQQTN